MAEEQRTDEEIAASVAAKVAEAEKLRADAIKAQAEARKAEAEARQQEESLKVTKLLVEAEERKEAKRRASDEEHRIYWFDDQVTNNSVKKCINTLSEWSRVEPGSDIEVIFSSPGGGIIAGMALFDFLQSLRHNGHRVITGAAGYAASMAGILLQAGDHRWVGQQSWIMIHRASFGVMGESYKVEDELEFVKRIEKRIIDIFVARSNLSGQKIKRNWERKDWWIDADQALEYGLVDEIRGQLKP